MTRRVITNFRAQDFKSGGEDVAKMATPKDEAPKPESNEVPVGTSAEIQDWVGDDLDRAQRALDKENENAQPRKGLVKHLETMLVEDNDDDEESNE